MGLKKNLDEVIVSKLYDEIIEGEWAPGTQISLDAIMEKYGVSRTPVIQALKKMNTVGVVRFTNKGHFYVPEYTLKEVQDIIDARLLLETYALEEIRDKNIAVDYDRLMNQAQKVFTAYQEGRTIDTRRGDLAFHSLLVQQSGNHCIYDLYLRVQRQFMVVNYLIGRYSALQQEISCADHVKVVEQMRGGDYNGAIDSIKKHVLIVHQKILERFSEQSA